MKYYIRRDARKIEGERGWLAVPDEGPATWVRANGSTIRQYRSSPQDRPGGYILKTMYKEVYAPSFLVMADPDLIVAEGL